MTALLTLIVLGGLGQDTVGIPCDDECKAVLTAALHWTIEELANEPSADPARIFVDVSLIRTQEDRATERQAVGRIARGMSLAVDDKSRQADFVKCAQQRQSRSCRDAAGLTSITAHAVKFTGPGKATAFSVIRVLGGQGGEGNWDSLRRSELLLEKRDGTWEVVGVGVRVVS